MIATARKRLPAEQRRAVIEDAAAQLFAERGYAGTRLDDIAAAARVTKPVLYRHFDSKKALYLALLERHRRDLPGFVEDVTEKGSELRVRAILDAWFSYVEANGHAWKMLFRDSGGGREIEAARLEVQSRARDVLVGFLAGEGDLAIPPDEVEPLAEFIRSGGAGLALWWLDHPDMPKATVVDVFARVVTGLIGGE